MTMGTMKMRVGRMGVGMLAITALTIALMLAGIGVIVLARRTGRCGVGV